MSTGRNNRTIPPFFLSEPAGEAETPAAAPGNVLETAARLADPTCCLLILVDPAASARPGWRLKRPVERRRRLPTASFLPTCSPR